MKGLLYRLALALVGLTGASVVLATPAGPAGPSPSYAGHIAPVDGSAASCENLIDDFLGFIDIPQPGWVYVDPGKFNEVAGEVTVSQVTHTDFPTVHDSHDLNVDIDPDDDFEGVLSTGNTSGEIEIEWEIGTFPNETSTDPERTLPKWVWPNNGDRAWANGAWIFDCGHPTDIGGTDHFKSEIHPPRAIAAMRDQVRPIPGTGTTPVRVTATDLYIHGQAGFVTEDLECGQDVILDIFGGCAQGEPHRGQPIDVDFEFDICTPPKPVDSAVLATTFEDGPGNNIGVAPVITVEPAAGGCVAPEFGPSQVHVEIPLAGTGVTPQQVYARRIFAGWLHPYDGLKHLSVTLNKGVLHEDMDTDPGDCECSFFWVSNNRAPDEWHRLTAFEIPTDDEAGFPCPSHDNTLNDWDDDDDCGNGNLNFSGPTWDFYLLNGMNYALKFRGYDQDCLDDLFGDHNLITSGLGILDCYAGSGLFTLEPGDNDEYATGLRTLNASETGGFSVGNPDGDYDFFFNAMDIPLTVEDSADLSLTKICKPDGTAFAGQQITCTILVYNPGPGLPRNVVVDDTLLTNVAPADYVLGTPTFVFQGFEGLPTECDAPTDIPGGKHFICNLGTVPVGGSAIITAMLTSDEGGDFNNRALVTTASTDPDTTNNEDVDGVTVVPVADLMIEKSVLGGGPIVAGTGFVYQLDVSNNGPSTATNVVVTDVVPAGMAVVSVSAPGGSCAAGVPGDPLQPTTCNLGSMADGESRTIQISVLVAPYVLGQVNNDSRISSGTVDLDNSDNVDTTPVTVVAHADLQLVKSDAPDLVVAGEPLTYEVRVTNAGPSLARDVVLSDPLPAEVTYVSTTIASGSGVCTLKPTNVLECEIDDLLPGAYALLFIHVIVDPSVPDGAQISNTATAMTSATDADGASDTETTDVEAVADLAITKLTDRDLFKPSTTVKYTIRVTNNGPSDAQNVQVVDTLPGSKIGYWVFDNGYVHDPDGCLLSGATLTCDFGTLAAGASVEFNIYFHVIGNKGLVTNTVMVSSTTDDPNAANNTAVRQNLIQGKSTGPRR